MTALESLWSLLCLHYGFYETQRNILGFPIWIYSFIDTYWWNKYIDSFEQKMWSNVLLLYLLINSNFRTEWQKFFKSRCSVKYFIFLTKKIVARVRQNETFDWLWNPCMASQQHTKKISKFIIDKNQQSNHIQLLDPT